MNSQPLQRAKLYALLFDTLISLSLSCNQGYGQTVVHGHVADKNGQPLANANVLLLNSGDSSLVKGDVTNTKGEYHLERIKNGSYLLNVRFIGYQEIFAPQLAIAGSGNKEIETIVLVPSSKQLEAVTIVSKKPVFEQKPDRMVINVQNSISNIGSNVVDVLERSPGIVVNRQGNSIEMNGKSGVMLMIDGKVIPASSKEATFLLLEGMNSANIEKIELITVPPSNLDAEGNAGYINIVLKKNTQYGTNGSYSVSLGYQKGPIGKAAINFNHRSVRTNFYGDFSWNSLYTREYLSLYHQSINNEQIIQTNSNLTRYFTRSNFDGTVGVDYEMNNRTFLGVMVTGYAHLLNIYSNGYGNFISNQQIDTVLSLYDQENHNLYNVNANVNLAHNYSKDSKIVLNANYLYTFDYNPIQYHYTYFDGNNDFLYDRQLRTNKETPLNSWIFQADYISTLSEKIDLEAGLKGTISRFTNQVIADSLSNNKWVEEYSFSNKVYLNETYPAGYVNVKVNTSRKTNLSLGLRYEYTISNLSSDTTKAIVDRHYGNFLPRVVFDYKINDNSSFSLAYFRRITRPKIWDLAPFVIFFDPYTFVSGNPNLLPSLSDNFDLRYSFKGFLLDISYSKVNNPIANFFPQIDSVTHVQTFGSRNLDYSKIWNAVLTVPVYVNSWWSMSNSLTATWNRLKTDYNNQPLSLSVLYYKIQTTQTFALPKHFYLELSGYYISTRTDDFALFYSFAPNGSLDFSVKKTFPKLGSFIFNCEDLLRTNTTYASINNSSQNLVSSVSFHPVFTTFRLTYSHNFGNNKVSERRNRQTGSEEYLERVK
ncbi:MAG: hypothetical protein C5B59_17670 [Bacteroidetes bacterium]|nr:MAG: hypothetical protein C5B59_17670 [Bacteroidota bacterium]